MKKLLPLFILFLAVSAYAAPLESPPAGGKEKKAATKKQHPPVPLPRILACTCMDGNYADYPQAVLRCKQEKEVFYYSSMENLHIKGYRLVQIIEVKNKRVYYFQKK